MLCLGIETSCDETAFALVENGRRLIASKLVSQTEVHRAFGGVVPEVAARRHLEAFNPLLDELLLEASGVLALPASEVLSAVSAIACTNGPGLIGTLLVGLAGAKAMAWALDKPLLTVDHIQAHVCANYIGTELEPPFIALVVSGGHTQIMHFKSYKEFEIVGQTIDDASGEAYDKVARILGLGYPGGPAVDRLASQGNPQAYSFPEGQVPGYDFSFSGLKTAVMRTVENPRSGLVAADVAASFQDAVNRVLFRKTVQCAKAYGVDRIVLAGGVAANSDLRSRFEKLALAEGFKIFRPPIALCTDNAAMVASAAFFSGNEADLSVGAYSRR
ncbi:MAG: tRNA (adenosine(37)-N6)-threonylcarbamoyltransferase complex transferase subunit TsaD [Candidatus Obscuribacter phosphatis]|uniref:tRNA N6-adenosine threonylcarbamoyltransferase n=1 Tax=Candidatus Obscuribacter phosphatis TaxID=1906157 RepID=A0A8J7P922_9BACT|nr:tRNA (adenosine(37)-N6)-threonylcarbamoyltransferase complex transferase subunit TsaD [Candidatus Obscuribacter phosphatis]